MSQPLPLEDFVIMIEKYPLIFEVDELGSMTEGVGLQPEFANFVHLHGAELKKAVDSAADELRGTGATWGEAMVKGFTHIIELFLGRPLVEEHLSMIVASIYNSQSPTARSERWLGEEI